MLEWNGIQEGGKQVRLHRVLGVGMDTREWKWQVVTQHSSEAHLTHTPVYPITSTYYIRIHICTKTSTLIKDIIISGY